MLVKEKYSHISEQFLFELSIEEPTPFNRSKRYFYAFWQSIKNLNIKDITFDETLRISKIIDIQDKAFKRPRYK